MRKRKTFLLKKAKRMSKDLDAAPIDSILPRIRQITPREMVHIGSLQIYTQ